MADYHVFKLNLQPDILHSYIEDGALDVLKRNVIYSAFISSFEITQYISDDYIKIKFMENDIEFKDEFKKLEQDTKLLKEKYSDILDKYSETEEIHYSKEFLRLNDKCGGVRRQLEYNYPILKQAYDEFDEDLIASEFNLQFDNAVGTGIRHLKKFYTIKYYIEEYDIDVTELYSNLEIVYSLDQERFYIKTNNESEALSCSKLLERVLNNNRESITHIGKININPIYTNIYFEGSSTEVSIVYVYPNANGPYERNSLIEAAKAKQEEIKLIGSDGEPLNTDVIIDEINERGLSGYIKELKTKGSTIVKQMLRVNRLPVEGDE